MKQIMLTQDKIAIIDDDDFERLNHYKWHAWWSGYGWYVKRSNKNHHINRESTLIHREIMNAPKNVQVDHINGDGLDNRKENLRFVTNQQNAFNKKSAHKNNKLGIKGVCWNKERKKFEAQIMLNYKRIHLGRFNVLGDADSAYRKAEEKHFGEFARAI